jgi:phosphoribosyl-dephospho-CoA transferase
MELKPHDLIQIQGMADFQSGQPFPDWVNDALFVTPWVVVRRAAIDNGLIPVGIRGQQRGQRYAAWLPEENIGKVVTPADLVDPAKWVAAFRSEQPPTIRTLRLITPILQRMRYTWGPTGSSGFQLATGVPSIKNTSDLDILIESPERISVEKAKHLLDSMECISLVRLDVQLNTPSGGISLKEYSQGQQVLIKTSTGPVLKNVSDSWPG